MPPAPPSEIVRSIVLAIEASQGSSTYLSDSVQTHPREFGVSYRGEHFKLWIYIWTLTPGGRAHLPDEFRIQKTSVDPPLDLNPDGPTLIMGYHQESGLFAGFDMRHHRDFTPGSPSAQIDISAIHEAVENGLGYSVKSNDEIAIGIRPDHFLFYALHHRDLHAEGADNLHQLEQAAHGELPEEDELVPTERLRVLKELSIYVRDANFRKRVCDAYGFACAVTDTQLNLVDAAHILPVTAGGPDEVSNGICLSPTMHRAFDSALIYLDTDYVMRINEIRLSQLADAGVTNGVDQLTSQLNEQIHLPENPDHQPTQTFIERANEYRQIW